MHFGSRRRQCIQCRKTWRVRQKKRGRKRVRAHSNLCIKYLQHATASMWARSKVGKDSERLLQLRLKRSRDVFLQKADWLETPKGEERLIAIVDAMIFYWQRKKYTCYLILLKRSEDTHAIITPYYLLPGGETLRGWRYVLDQLPENTLARIKVVVCDGHRGPVVYACQHRWLIQRCHFHLLSAIQGRRSRFGKSRHQEEGGRVYALVQECLRTEDENRAERLRFKIDDEAHNTTSPQLRKILKGFVHYYQDFRTYRYHPKFNLPTTTNALESLNGCVKGLQYRARGFATRESFEKWLTALLKFKKKVLCQGWKNQPKYCR